MLGLGRESVGKEDIIERRYRKRKREKYSKEIKVQIKERKVQNKERKVQSKERKIQSKERKVQSTPCMHTHIACIRELFNAAWLNR